MLVLVSLNKSVISLINKPFTYILYSSTSRCYKHNILNGRISNRYMVSTAQIGDISTEEDDQTSPSLQTNNNVLHTVVVHRNRQSQSFREGTPLIFGGSVASTFTDYCNNDISHNIEETSTIPTGALVGVVVSRDSPPKNNKGKGKRDSRGKSRRNDNRKKDEPETVAPHYNLIGNMDNEEVRKQRDMITQSQLIGYGVFNPNSMYRVRLLCHDTIHPTLTKEIRSMRKLVQRGKGEEDDMNNLQLKMILERKVNDAINTRLSLNLPSEGSTDTYRLLNGEGDGLSGLVVDILGGSTAIVMSSAAWVELHKDIILQVLEEKLNNHPSYVDTDVDIVWRNTPSRLKQDGYLVEGSGNNEENEKSEQSVIATESNVKYMTFPYSKGQKTGYYCDQRDNRRMVAELCEDKRVLDLCCYNGGFALTAMIHGQASSALGVDSSQDAIDACNQNSKLNNIDDEDISFVKDDIATFMKSAMEKEDSYDVIILDPPKLAPSIRDLDKASRKYHALNRDAMNLIDKSKGGLLLTCTCSASMSQKDGGQYFLNMVNGAALSAKRRVTLLKVNGAAPCHTQSPASFPAGQYLTASLFHVSHQGP